MIYNVIIPSPGESITEVEMGRWLVEDGDLVKADQEIGEVESDKATLPLLANASGKITLSIGEGDTITVGETAATIDNSVAVEQSDSTPQSSPEETKETLVEEVKQNAVPTVQTEKAEPTVETQTPVNNALAQVKVTPVAQQMMHENNLNIEKVIAGLQRITKQEIDLVLSHANMPEEGKPKASRDVEKTPMSALRKKLSQRLVSVKNETAMLTTFNEVDMSRVMEIRKSYQPKFVEKHGLKLGFMSLFTKAASRALELHPMVNAYIDNEEIVKPAYHDIGIAVSSDKGLMVPIVRNAESKSIPTIEKEIKELAQKVRNKKLSLGEMTGGTFTITNGGVFGSMMSTPIINPPQSGILGMHNIIERPVAVNGEVVIRPMMYVALSYDHRIIDGKDSVGFLMKVKQFIENPETLLTGNRLFEEMFEL